MILWHLDAMLKKRDMTPYKLAQRMGVKHGSIYRLAGKTSILRISSTTLDPLCAILKCQPGHLMTYVPNPTSELET